MRQFCLILVKEYREAKYIVKLAEKAARREKVRGRKTLEKEYIE